MNAAKKSSAPLPVNLALQGGGAHGAYSWGVLDQLLGDGRLHIHAISAASSGALNAVVLAQGMMENGVAGAQQALHDFWHRVSLAAGLMPIKPAFMQKMLGPVPLALELNPSFMAVDFITRMFSPYQFNLFDINPVRSIVEEMVDFERLAKESPIKLFLNATHVKTGKVKVFKGADITLDSTMASACLPFFFKTVEVNGEPYWDGGYTGNPALYPLFYHTECEDILVVQTTPLLVEDVPTQAADIMDRINEISFNASLMGEMRAIAFVAKLLESGVLPEKRHKAMRVHMVEAQEILASLGRHSKLNADWDFLCHLRDVGGQSAVEWLSAHAAAVGVRSSIDINDVFL